MADHTNNHGNADPLLTVVEPQPIEATEPPPARIDTGLACLVMMARLHGVAADADQLAHEFAAGGGFGIAGIQLAANGLIFKPRRSGLILRG